MKFLKIQVILCIGKFWPNWKKGGKIRKTYGAIAGLAQGGTYLDGGLAVDVNWPESWAGGSKGDDRAAFYLGNIQSLGWKERYA